MGGEQEAPRGLRGYGGWGSLTPEARKSGVRTTKNSNRPGPMPGQGNVGSGGRG